MATLKLPSWLHWGEQPTKESSELLSESARARSFVQNAYAESGGPTADLKRVYESFVKNEQRRDSGSQ